jgi:amino acid adenylation domain-containing protein
MNIYQLMSQHRERDIHLFTKDGKLKIDAPKGVLNEETLDLIKKNKIDIIRYLAKKSFLSKDITRIETLGGSPLSHAQQRMWLTQSVIADKTTYNMLGAIDIEGKVDEKIVDKVFNSIVERHHILRTHYIEQDGQTLQVVDDNLGFEVEHFDFSEISSRDQEQASAKGYQELSSHIFDLLKGTLLRVQLVRLEKTRYRLFFLTHHIACDGWSLGNLKKEFIQGYAILESGNNLALPALPIQYAEYARWERDITSSEFISQLDEFWSHKLDDLPSVHKLTLDHTRPRQQSFAGDIILRQIDSRIYTDVKRLANDNDATVFMIVYAIFSCLLHRYSGESDIVMATPVANREKHELSELIGFVANTVLLRSKHDGNLSFSEFIKCCREELLQVYDNQLMPFDRVVELINPERSLSYNALFQIMLTQSADSGEQQFATKNALFKEASGYQARTSQFDLLLDFGVNDKGEMQFQWQYATDLFDANTIARMADHFEELLRAVIKSPEQKVRQLNFLSQGESDLLVDGFNQNQDLSLIERPWTTYFDEQVLANPQKVVAQCGANSLSFAALNVASRTFAQALNAMGIGKEDMVALLDHRGLDLLVAIVGVLRAGAAYLPLDPSNPSQRWLTILNQADPKCLIIGDRLGVEQRWLKRKWRKEKIHAFDAVSAFEYSGNDVVLSAPELDDLAYVIYTSGSTGTPKGVMIEHRGMINNMRAKEEPLGLGVNDVIAQTASQCFDISVWQFLTAPIIGATVLIIEDEHSKDPHALVESLRLNKVSIWEPVPVMLSAVIEEMSNTQQGLPCLRWVLPTGEALNTDIVDRWFALQPQVQQITPLMNAYGPAECSDDVSFEAIFEATDRVLIGSPVANVRLYVVDEHLSLVPIGVVGELAISGPMVGRGYLNAPELTKAVFKVNPFAKEDADKRMYLSGDLVKRFADGRLRYIGRKDDQVKIRGFRIELGEIENALSEHQAIKIGAVLVHDFSETEGEFDNRLVAYVCPQNAKTFSSDDAIEELGLQLPEYMVPSIFIILDSLPVSANGKINRKALPKPDANLLATERYEAPLTELEKSLCDIWQEVLGIKRVGRKDNFFRLGGHSLSATRLVSVINQKFALNLPLKAVFESQSLDALAQAVLALESGVQIPAIERVSREAALPCSYAQQRLWLLDKIDGGSAHYNMSGKICLRGELDFAALQHALLSIVERHESLRTSFKENQYGEPVQVIQSAKRFTVGLIDLSVREELSSVRREALNRLMEEEASRAFDLSQDLMLRATLVTVANNEHYFLVTMHHIASDGWSMAILINEFCQLYKAFIDGEESPLLPLAIQYADYAHWQRHWLQGDVLEAQLSYWDEKLQNLPTTHSLPLDYPRQPVQSFNGAKITNQLDQDTYQKFGSLCRQEGATLFMGLHAVFSILLARYSQEQDIVVGTPIANREQGEVSNLIGFFVNSLVLRSDLSGNPSFNDVLAQSRETLMSAYAHQQVPFEQIVERLQPERSLSHSPLFQVMLALQNNEDGTLDIPGLQIDDVEYDRNSVVAKYELCLDVHEGKTNLELDWTYNTSLFDASTIVRMAKHFEQILIAVTQLPDQKSHHLSFLSECEKKQLIEGFNQTHNPSLIDRPWTMYFDDQAIANPLKVVAQCRDSTLSYAELDRASRQVALAFQAMGIGKEDVVAVLDYRGLDLLVAIVGILRAGAAYLPLDPSHPFQRWSAIIAEAKPALLVLGDKLSLEAEISQICPVSYFSNVQSYVKTSVGELTQPRLDDLAYVIYTSGTTGKPKGVMIEHRGLINNIRAKEEPLGLSAEDVIAQTASQCFDISVWQFLTAPVIGAKVLIIEDEYSQDPEALMGSLALNEVSIWEPVPAMLLAVIEQMEAAQQGLPALRWVLPTGEALNTNVVGRWFALQPQVQQKTPLMNAYGPAECSDDVAFEAIFEATDCVLIGSPVANVNLHVIDEYLGLVPIGVIGELAISGPMVGRGYLGAPELTESVFKINPFSKDERNTRLYLSGDLVKRLPDGRLEYISRKDDQVKIRGFRIELGEIDNCINQLAEINSGIVLVHDFSDAEDGSDNRLVAYVCPQSSDVFSADDVIGRLRQRLPEYMVPSVFICLDAMPMSDNGKIDRKALPKPDVNLLRENYEAPQTDLEKDLCDIWQDVLGLEQVGINDNFFRLGGHSLLVMQVISRVQKLGYSSNARQFFAATNLAKFAIDIECNQTEVFRASPNLIPISCDEILPNMLPLVTLTQDEIHTIASHVPGGMENIQDIYPLVPLQQGMLFTHITSEGNDPYVEHSLFEVKDKSTLDHFLSALSIILQRHDTLRTAVLWEDLSQAVQVVQRQAKLPVCWKEFSAADDVRDIMLTMCVDGAQMLNISSAPLLRVTVGGDPNSGKYFVFLQCHHLVTDHVGLEIIEREFSEIQAGRVEQLDTPVPYREFVAHSLQQAETSNAQSYFKELLSDVDEATAPFDLVDIQGDGRNLHEQSLLLPNEVSQNILRVLATLQLSPAAFFHAVFALVIAACSGKRDIVFGTVLSGRLQGTVGAENTIGMFMNTLPMRASIDQQAALGFVQKVQTDLRELLQYEQTSLALTKSCSGLKESAPLFSAILNYRHTDNSNDVNGDISLISGQERTNYPFNVDINDYGNDFGFTVQVDKKISSLRIAEYMQTTTETLLASLEKNSKQPLNSLSVLPQVEVNQQLYTWNDTQSEYAKESCAHELFEFYAKMQPQAPAVVIQGETLSYAELNERANRLAHYLVENQLVQIDSLIGLCVERSMEMIVGIFAILKAGAAYVPLDPDYPNERLSYIIEDAALKTIITQNDVLARCPISHDKALCLDSENILDQLSKCSSSDFIPKDLGLDPNKLAYVIYTSGSTGRPKGTLVEHGGLCNLVSSMQNYYSLEHSDRVLQFAPVGFDMSVEEIFGALCCGCALVLRSDDCISSVEIFWSYCEKYELSVLNLPTAFWHEVAKDDACEIPACIRHISVGGDKVSPSALAAWHQKTSHLPALVNAYGPTEYTVNASFSRLEGQYKSVIGKPLNNTQLYVLDAVQKLVPVGVVGELCIGGIGLARGYLNRPNLTDKKFIPNPYAQKGNKQLSEKIYRTGDLVRWLHDGNLEFVGRVDQQVKIRGFRVELGEVEQGLARIDVVEDALVIAKDSGNDGLRLVAYVIPKSEHSNGVCELAKESSEKQLVEYLRQELFEHLPVYMVPSSFVIMDQFPLTPNGKIDRKNLPEAIITLMATEYLAPRTEMEKVICDIWRDLLGLDRIGVNDNFFQLGGHSLMAMRCISKLKLATGVVIGIKEIFESDSLEELANIADIARALSKNNALKEQTELEEEIEW